MIFFKKKQKAKGPDKYEDYKCLIPYSINIILEDDTAHSYESINDYGVTFRVYDDNIIIYQCQTYAGNVEVLYLKKVKFYRVTPKEVIKQRRVN